MDIDFIEIAPINQYGKMDNECRMKFLDEYKKNIQEGKLSGVLENASSAPADRLLKDILFYCYYELKKRIAEGENSPHISFYNKEYCTEHDNIFTIDLLEALWVLSNKKFKEVVDGLEHENSIA